jgi:tetratricopeptide (TPR) repeat protein
LLLLWTQTDVTALAEERLRAGRPAEAVEILTPLADGGASAVALRLRGTAYQTLGDPRSAAADFERACEIDPRDLESRVRLGQVRLSLGRPAEAEKDFERAVAIAPESGGPHFLLGVARFRQENYAGARSAVERALRLPPRNVKVPLLLVRVLDELGAFTDAEAVVDSWSDEPRELEALAYGLLEQKDDNRAARVFERLAAKGDAEASILVNLGYCYMNVGAFEKARRPLQLALDKDPSRGFASYLLGSALVKLGDEEGARASLERALQDVSDVSISSPRAGDNVRALAHTELARLLTSEGRTEEAIGHCRKAIETSPYRAEAHYLLGQLLLQSGEPEAGRQAFADFQKLKELESAVDEIVNRVLLNPQDVPAVVELHRLYLKQARPDKAVEALQQARSVDAEHPDVLLATAELLRARGDLAGARASVERLLAVDPNAAGGLYLAATLDLMASDFAAAERKLRRVLELDPNHAEAASDLGVLLDRAGRSDEAIALFERSIAANPELALPRNGLGVVLFKLGEIERAAALFETARDLAPTYVQARQNLAEAYRKLGRDAEAAAELAAVEKLSHPQR